MRVLVVGGGHASLPLLANARSFRERGHEVALVSDCDRLWYSGMTPEHLGAVYTRDDVTIDLAAICEREGVRWIPEAAAHLDPEARFVETVSGGREPYDVCAVDVGATNPAAQRAPEAVRTKPLHRIAALTAFLAEVVAGEEARMLVIVGGGAAGVEVALNLTARPDLDGRLLVTIVEPGDGLLGSFPGRARRWAERTLRERGVTIRLGAEVEAVEGQEVRLSDATTLTADRVLWATGSVGHPWLASSLDADDRGFVHVTCSLQARRYPRVFVAGDAALVQDHENLARVGVHAVKQGPTLADNVRTMADALERDEEAHSVALSEWRPYPAAPLILSTGVRDGLLVVGPLAVRGAWALALKHRVDRAWIEPFLTTEPSWDSRIDLRSAADGPAGLAPEGGAQEG